MHYTLTPATAEDEPFLHDLFMDVRGPDFQHFPPPMAEQLLAMQFRAQTMSYGTHFPQAVCEIISIGGERAGRLLVDTNDERMHLVDIALLGRFRNQGTGTAVMKQLCETAKSSGRLLELSVRGSNPAMLLYHRLGFVAAGGDETNVRMEWQPGTAVAEAPHGGDSMIAGSTSSVPDEEVQPDYTQRYFRTLVGQTVMTRWNPPFGESARPAQPLLVESVEPLQRPERGTAVELGDSFVIRLSGSVEEVLQPQTVEIQPQNGVAMILFISPTGPEHGRMRYEAIFNRIQPIA